jgi:phytoene dehydrogenase-like protein
MVDAVVVGAGHNGLVAANLLADAGWDVVVLEAGGEPGGAVRSGEITVPGFTHDLFSAFYPLAVASPVLRRLELERFGLRWCRAPLVLAHPTEEGCAVLSTDLDETAESLEGFASGDGSAWRDLYDLWLRVSDQVIGALLRPFPPVMAASRLVARLRRDLLRFARFALLPARTLSQEWFHGSGGALLLAGNAMHADLGPESVLSGFFGWLLASLGQQHGFPVPEGGAARLTDALVTRLERRGGRIECNTPVERVLVRDGRAVGVRTSAGDEVAARRAVLADVSAPVLYLDLVGKEHLPSRFAQDLERFHWDNATVKVDWALKGPIPWSHKPARRAGTVHVSRSFNHLSELSAQIAMGYVPARPFLVMGQIGRASCRERV